MSASILLTGPLQIFKHSAAAWLGFISGSGSSNYLECFISGGNCLKSSFLPGASLISTAQAWEPRRRQVQGSLTAGSGCVLFITAVSPENTRFFDQEVFYPR